jgi:hypothetical protein
MKFSFFIAAVLMAVAAAATTVGAEEKPVPLKPGPGEDAVANCNACHSLDYIPMNAPFMTRKTWEAEVTKMINAYGAPIDSADAKTITDYLAHNYGRPD